MPLLTYFCIFWFVGLTVNPRTKFEGFSYTRSIDIEGSQNYKSRSRDVGHTLFTYFCIFWILGLAVNLRTEFEGSSCTYSLDTEWVPKF